MLPLLRLDLLEFWIFSLEVFSTVRNGLIILDIIPLL